MSNQASQLTLGGRLTLLCVAVLIGCLIFLFGPKSEQPTPVISNIPPSFEQLAPPDPTFSISHPSEAQTKAAISIREIDPNLGRLLKQGEFEQLTEYLLTHAAQATNAKQPKQLAEILSLLGQIAIEKQNLDTAEVYLLEALDVLNNINAPKTKAEIYVQLGRTHLKSRDIARRAGYAYDALQVGRLQMQNGQFYSAEQYFNVAIEHNLSIGRYNAAASTYTSLSKLHQKAGDQYQSEQALIESARLYAASGQATIAQQQLGQLKSSDIDDWRIFGLEQEITENLKQYEQEIQQIAIAQDYRRLYNHYITQENYQQAWHFRLLSNQSLKGITRRDMFYRQQGVLALLYNSNNNMAQAKNYLSKANNAFSQYGREDLTQQVQILNLQNF